MSGGRAKALFIAATAQHAGKSTTSLGVYSGLSKRFDKVGFIKPVGQQYITTAEGDRVDKDVRLFREFFNIDSCSYTDMSPVILPAGYTKQYSKVAAPP